MIGPRSQCYKSGLKAIIRPCGSGEEILTSFYHIWAWQPSWSCDPETPHKLSIPTKRCSTCNLVLIGQAVLEKMFENDGHIHVNYSPGAGVDNPQGSIFSYGHKSCVTGHLL